MKQTLIIIFWALGAIHCSRDPEEALALPDMPPPAVEGSIPFDQFMGANAFVDDPIDRMQAVGFIREYHNWGWDEGNGDDGAVYPNNQIRWAPSRVIPWDFDDYYSRVNAAGLLISPCTQNSVRWLSHGEEFRAADKPLDKPGLSPTDPSSYQAKAHYMYQYAARYGSTKVDADKLTLAPDQESRSGLGLIRYLEDWNEPNKDWEGRDAEFTPEEYAAMLSADYDGHANTMKGGTGTFGIKNADPQMKVVMAGLAGTSLEYIGRMKRWFEANRQDRKFAADVLNVHMYTFKDERGWQGGGPARSPEAGKLKEVMQEIVEYRDKNLPGVEVWISEFGWDTNPASPLSPPVIGPFDVQEVQAQWLVRAYLLLASAGVDRAQMYMLRDVDPNSAIWYSTCGLVGPKGDWTPKKSWFYVYTLKETLKGMRFIGEETSSDPNIRIYKFKDMESERGAYAVWATTSRNYTVQNHPVPLSPDAGNASLVQMVPGETAGRKTALTVSNRQVRLNVSERPVFVLVDEID